eukprot:1138722-Pelagomonas_calceolata.AAC.1
MLVDKYMDLKVFEEHAVQFYMAAQQRIKEYMHEHDLRNRPHALIWLSKVYGNPAGMYTCKCEKRQCCSLRRFLGVRSTATKWPVPRERGQEPLQFYWFRATVNFFNSLLDPNSETFRRVLKANLKIANSEESCWSAHVSTAVSGMRYEDVFKQKMLSASKIPMQDFLEDLRYRQKKVWREADALIGAKNLQIKQHAHPFVFYHIYSRIWMKKSREM